MLALQCVVSESVGKMPRPLPEGQGAAGSGNSFISKPARGWLHSDQMITKEGITYAVRYIGCLEILTSMKSLDFDTRSQVAKECINRVCEAAGLKTADKKRKDTLDFVAYVAKDLKDWRACYVLECGGGLAQDVITTIGQAFELRFKEFLTRPSYVTCTLNGDDRDYYNDLPGKIPPELSPPPVPPLPNMHSTQTMNKPSASASTSSTLPREHQPVQQRDTNDRTVAREPVSVSSNLIDLNCEAPPPPIPAPRREHDYVNDIVINNNRDVFDMQPFSSAMTSEAITPASQRIQLQKEIWFHGPVSRQEAEMLLAKDGDFCVRESQGSPGQYVLTGMQGGIKKHLLLVDPEGVVRTKDRMFESVSHLINYHFENELPIISAESALVLRQPVHRQQPS